MVLTKKQQRAITLMFDKQMSKADIARELDINASTLWRWSTTDEFIEAMTSYAHKAISQSTSKALGTMIGLLDARSEMVRFNAAKDLLDRAGFAPTEKVDLNGNDINIKIGSGDDG